MGFSWAWADSPERGLCESQVFFWALPTCTMGWHRKRPLLDVGPSVLNLSASITVRNKSLLFISDSASGIVSQQGKTDKTPGFPKLHLRPPSSCNLPSLPGKWEIYLFCTRYQNYFIISLLIGNTLRGLFNLRPRFGLGNSIYLYSSGMLKFKNYFFSSCGGCS